jgi:hypothetical protein
MGMKGLAMLENVPAEFEDLCEPLRAATAPWVQLDQQFVASDFGLADADMFMKSDADLVEIAIINGKVQRTYKSRS